MAGGFGGTLAAMGRSLMAGIGGPSAYPVAPGLRDLAPDRQTARMAVRTSTPSGRAIATARDGKTNPPVTSSTDPATLGELAKALAGGRVTLENPDRWKGMQSFWLPPASPEQQWSGLRLDESAIGDYPPYRLLELLCDLSPDIARALWDTNRMLCGEWSVRCFDLKTKQPHPVAQARIAAFIDRLTERHGAFEVVLVRLFQNAYLRGAFFSELVLDRTARLAVDLATPDPLSVRFKEVPDPETGGVRWELGQLQSGTYVPLNRPTVRYVPLDPLPGVPYGRSPLAPSLFPALFMLAMLHDIRRVIAQQGYPRLDIEIDFNAMAALMPPEAMSDPATLNRWAQDHINQIAAIYARIPPDAAYVHANTIKLNKPVGTVDASSLGGVAGVIEALERLLVRALKTMPLLMGISDGVSEANANRQWEIQLTGLRHPSRLCETQVERHMTLALRAEGIQAGVDFSFKENRKSEEQRDEQVFQLRLTNATAAFRAGFWSQDQASQHAVRQDADVPEPRQMAPDPVADPKQETTPGSNTPSTPPKGGDGMGKDKTGGKPKPKVRGLDDERVMWEMDPDEPGVIRRVVWPERGDRDERREA